MSLSYAARLTQGVDYGECGVPEKEDTPRVRQRQLAKLEQLLRDARAVVLHTGAGISTSCGIRDFRGPNGVWTRERRGLGLQLLPDDVPFEEASPSLTHMAIVGLVRAGRVRFVVSQNVDGLHLRSGLPSEQLAELHGNIFQERCEHCERVYFRNFDVGGVGFAATGRRCDAPCGGELVDMVLDWQDALPDRDLTLARVSVHPLFEAAPTHPVRVAAHAAQRFGRHTGDLIARAACVRAAAAGAGQVQCRRKAAQTRRQERRRRGQ